MRGRWQTANPDFADRRAGRGPHVVRELVGAGEPRAHLRRNALAKLGQHDAATGPLEQPPAALLLELADPAADVRLACSIGQGHLAEAAELRGVDEELPGGVFHERL